MMLSTMERSGIHQEQTHNEIKSRTSSFVERQRRNSVERLTITEAHLERVFRTSDPTKSFDHRIC